VTDISTVLTNIFCLLLNKTLRNCGPGITSVAAAFAVEDAQGHDDGDGDQHPPDGR
jgi:hypothetical protein